MVRKYGNQLDPFNMKTNLLFGFVEAAHTHLGRVKRIWYLSPIRAAKVQASLRIRAVSPEPPLLAHISNESRRTFRQKARSLAPLNGWACAVKICHDGMLDDTNFSWRATFAFTPWAGIASWRENISPCSSDCSKCSQLFVLSMHRSQCGFSNLTVGRTN